MSFSALIMAGGKARRLKLEVEKPLLNFRGKPMIDCIIEALDIEEIERVAVAVTENTPETKAYLEEKGMEVIITPAKGYVEDLTYALRKLRLGKTITLTSDLPLIRKKDIKYVLSEYTSRGCPSLAVLCREEVYKKLGLRADIKLPEGIPTGINVLDGEYLEGEQCYLVVSNPRLAVNVNYNEDLKIAEKVLEEVEDATE